MNAVALFPKVIRGFGQTRQGVPVRGQEIAGAANHRRVERPDELHVAHPLVMLPQRPENEGCFVFLNRQLRISRRGRPRDAKTSRANRRDCTCAADNPRGTSRPCRTCKSSWRLPAARLDPAHRRPARRRAATYRSTYPGCSPDNRCRWRRGLRLDCRSGSQDQKALLVEGDQLVRQIAVGNVVLVDPPVPVGADAVDEEFGAALAHQFIDELDACVIFRDGQPVVHRLVRLRWTCTPMVLSTSPCEMGLHGQFAVFGVAPGPFRAVWRVTPIAY